MGTLAGICPCCGQYRTGRCTSCQTQTCITVNPGRMVTPNDLLSEEINAAFNACMANPNLGDRKKDFIVRLNNLLPEKLLHNVRMSRFKKVKAEISAVDLDYKNRALNKVIDGLLLTVCKLMKRHDLI